MANEKRLIDANALKKEIVDFKVNFHAQNQDYGTGYFSALSVVEGMLAYAPTVDAVEVVRCQNCTGYHPYGKDSIGLVTWGKCKKIDMDVDKAGSPFITEWGKWLKQPAEGG